MKIILKDPIAVYYTSFMIITVAAPVALYVFLRAFKLSLVIAFLITLFFLCSDINMSFNAWPKISHFAILFLCVVLALSINIKKPATYFILSTIFIFLMSYIRPEYFLSFGIMSVITLCWIIFKEKGKLEKMQWSFIAISVFVIVFLSLHPGLALSNDKRTVTAFQQHFAWNYCFFWHHVPSADWFNYREITAQFFGKANTFLGFLKANPEYFFRHVFYNIEHYFSNVYVKIGAILFSDHMFGMPFWMGWLLWFVIIVYKIIYVGTGSYFRQIKSFVTEYKFPLLVLLIFTIPSLISSVLLAPREHYLVLQFPMYFIIFTALLSPRKNKTTNSAGKWGIPITLVIILGAYFTLPAISSYKYKNLWEYYNKQYCLNAIKKIRQLNIHEKVVLLESEGGFDIYTGKNYLTAPGFFKNKPFYDYIKPLNINMIYVSTILSHDRRFTEDPQWRDFESHFAEKGFEKISIPASGPGYYLYVKKELLSKPD